MGQLELHAIKYQVAFYLINLGEKRAIKTIKKNLIVAEDKDILFAEVDILRKLDHPNIVKLYELY